MGELQLLHIKNASKDFISERVPINYRTRFECNWSVAKKWKKGKNTHAPSWQKMPVPCRSVAHSLLASHTYFCMHTSSEVFRVLT
jgi:hypothetical protein